MNIVSFLFYNKKTKGSQNCTVSGTPGTGTRAMCAVIEYRIYVEILTTHRFAYFYSRTILQIMVQNTLNRLISLYRGQVL